MLLISDKRMPVDAPIVVLCRRCCLNMADIVCGVTLNSLAASEQETSISGGLTQ